MVGVIVNIIIMIPMLLLAITFSKGKGAFLIAGYNTMPESEKKKINEIEMCKFMSKIMYGICLSLLLFALSELLVLQILFIIGFVLCIGLVVFAVVYSSTGNRFNNEIDQ